MVSFGDWKFLIPGRKYPRIVTSSPPRVLQLPGLMVTPRSGTDERGLTPWRRANFSTVVRYATSCLVSLASTVHTWIAHKILAPTKTFFFGSAAPSSSIIASYMLNPASLCGCSSCTSLPIGGANVTHWYVLSACA